MSARVFALVVAGVIGMGALAGCSETDDQGTPSAPTSEQKVTDGLLAEYGLDGMSGRELVDHLDEVKKDDRAANLIASVRPNEVLVSSDGSEPISVPIEGDDVYVSVAPYLTYTHDCYFHSLTTCVGEMQNADVDVTVTDAATGETVLEEGMTTFDNGFVGLWLPADRDLTITIESDGKSATERVSTAGDEALTCLTTMKLT